MLSKNISFQEMPGCCFFAVRETKFYKMFPADELLFLSPEPGTPESAAGGFARRVYVLALAEPACPGNRDFLSKVLSAVQLNLDKDTLFAEIPASLPVSFAAELKKKQPEHVMIFGIHPAQLGLRIDAPLYKPVAFYGVTWLFADAVSVLEPDKNKKGLLWAALKQIFL